MEKHFWNHMDGISRNEITELQLKRLKEQVEYLSNHSLFYQRIFREHKIASDDFKSLDDLRRIPFSDKYMVSESQ
ncbi:MAG: phenylacetate--CoA ligase family protein, partial [Deltaproteobacteria bacterium]|nr:phenylacetate--CoA ligase family protein [Deltaproteobacteria bacterium]